MKDESFLPLVTILVPIYNISAYIERCALSIINQTYKNIEVIFINDCTPDDSIHILNSVLQKHPGVKAKIIFHEKNRGLAAARNTGVSAATGEYILHVDGDDYIKNDTVSVLVATANKYNSDFVIANFIECYRDKQKYIKRKFKNRNLYLKKILSFDATPSIWGNLIRRELYIQNDIKTIEGFDFGEDYIVLSKLVYYAKQINHNNEFLYFYDMTRDTSIMRSSFSQKKVDSLIKSNEFLKNFFLKLDNGYYHNSLLIASYKTLNNLLLNNRYVEEYYISLLSNYNHIPFIFKLYWKNLKNQYDIIAKFIYKFIQLLEY